MSSYVRAIRPIPQPGGREILPGTHLQLPEQKLEELIKAGLAVRVKDKTAAPAKAEPKKKVAK